MTAGPLAWLHPEATVRYHHDGTVDTYDARRIAADVLAATDRWAEIGLPDRAPVLLATGSRWQTLVDLFALWQLDLVPVLLSDRLGGESYRLLAATSGARAARVTNAVSRALRGGQVLETTDSAVLLRLPDAGPVSGTLPPGPLVALATSGTTGLPKAVVHRLDRLVRNADMHWTSVGEPEPASVFAMAQSLFFSSALVCGVLGVLARPMRLVLIEPPFQPAGWLAAAVAAGATHTAMTPHLLRWVLREGGLPPALRSLTVGGDGLADATTAELTAGFRGTACTTYGLTEAGPRVATHRLTDDPAGWDRLGQPLPGVSWRLAGDGALRELVVRTPTRAAGVLADCRFLPAEGTEVHTGDLCVATQDGGVRFVSRAHGVVTVGGEKVYLGLVERVLMQHPLVRAVRVRPVGEDPETLCAEVLTGGAELDAGALRGWCRGRLRAIEIPRIFLAAPEQAQLSK